MAICIFNLTSSIIAVKRIIGQSIENSVNFIYNICQYIFFVNFQYICSKKRKKFKEYSQEF